MMFIIKDKKSKEVKHNLHEIKKLVHELMECFEAASHERDEEDDDEYYHYHTRREERDSKDYDDDYGRDMARGRRMARPRY